MLVGVKKNMVKISSSIIFFLSFLLLFNFSPLKTFAATLSISPASGTFQIGEKLSLRIVAASNNDPFNAVSATVSFPTSLFSIESISKSNSVLDFWVSEPAVSKSTGTVRFEGISLGGSKVSTGNVITVNLRAIKVGTGKASFQSAQILANDGNGTDVTGSLIGANYSVEEAAPSPIPLPPEPTMPPEPSQPLPTLKAPEIMLGTKYGVQAITGISDYEEAQVLVTFTSSVGTRILILGDADSNGEFSLVVPNSLKHGIYKVTAIMIREDKTNSETSNAITIKVGNILSDVGWGVGLLLALLILSVIYLILRTHMHIFGNNIQNRSSVNHANKTENIVHKSFDVLREDVLNLDNKKLTVGEHKHISEIKKDMDSAEKIITKEVKGSE